MKINSDKWYVILSSNDKNKKTELNGEVINNTQVQKLLGVHIDYKLKFDTHIETLKLYVKWWERSFLSLPKL